MASLRSQLERLESLREKFGALATDEKLRLLADLEHKSLSHAAEVARLHGALRFSPATINPSPHLLFVRKTSLAPLFEFSDAGFIGIQTD